MTFFFPFVFLLVRVQRGTLCGVLLVYVFRLSVVVFILTRFNQRERVVSAVTTVSIQGSHGFLCPSFLLFPTQSILLNIIKSGGGLI